MDWYVPRSGLGQCISVMLQDRKEHALIPVASYFDMSGQLENYKWLVLSGIAAEDTVWGDFCADWKKVLDSHPLKPKYIHMREAIPRIKEFDWRKGWTDAKVQHLVGELLMLLSHADKKRLKMSFCAIDMDAYRKLQSEGLDMLPCVDICNLNCPEIVLSWWVVKWPGVIDSLHFFFDIGEPFKTPFEEKWIRMKNSFLDPTGQDYLWQMLQSVTTIGDKEKHPPIQAADVLAYGIYRQLSLDTDKPFRYMADIILNCIPSIGNVWTEEKLREKYEKK